MQPYYIPSHIDEFNYIYSANLDAYNLRKGKQQQCEMHTAVFNEFDIMFTDFDKIYTKPATPIENLGIIESLALDRSPINKLHKEGSKKAAQTKDMEFISNNEIANVIRNKKHVYNYTFSTSAKRIFENDMKFINPKKKDYQAAVELLSKLNVTNKKIIAINGRNLNKIPERNQLFIPVIEGLINCNYFVINLTINPPELSYPSESYFELPKSNLSYSDIVSFFLISDCVLSVCDSGGVNVHILTEANFIFLGPGGWLDNPSIGYVGKSLLDIRKEKTCFFTEHQIDYSIDTVVESLAKIPLKAFHTNFFDEAKIVVL